MSDYFDIIQFLCWLVGAFFLGAAWATHREHKYHMETFDLWKAADKRADDRRETLIANFMKIAEEEDVKVRVLACGWALTEFFAGVARSQRVP